MAVPRNTRQKALIESALKNSSGFVSAPDLQRRLEDSGDYISLATVYRQLNVLAEYGRADTVRLDGRQLFRLCAEEDESLSDSLDNACSRTAANEERGGCDSSGADSPQAGGEHNGFLNRRHRHKHHHHLVCRKCGNNVEIEPPDDKWMHSTAEKHGFTVESHTLEVFGLCSSCKSE